MAGKLRTIDTFSGTGGISLALQEFTTTTLYCEINPYCQAVLSERMKEGRLDRAPIHGDIKSLHLAPDAAPEMIMGGSPCTDVSCIGLKQGIADGPQSSLFYEIVRIVDETPSIKVVFLENVANILKCGLADVIAELRKRDFNIYWTTKSAGSMGAPHMRNRWFCLATKAGYEVDLSRFEGASLARTTTDHWTVEPARRFTFRPATKEDATYDPNWALRCACMGNAVVPAVVRAAFVDLLKMHKNWQSLRATLLDYGGPATELNYPFPESCVIIGDAYFAMPYRAAGATAPATALGPVEVKINPERTVSYNTLPTPRRGVVHACMPTERSVHDLPTLLVHSEVNMPIIKEELGVEELPEKLTSILYPNVQYVEWMMGYEADWTRIATVMARQSGSSPPDRGAVDNEGGVSLPDGGTLSDLDEEGEPRPPPEPASRNRSSGGRTRTTAPNISPEKRLNALNLFHREVFPHKTIKDICADWRELPQAERKQYADRARTLRATA